MDIKNNNEIDDITVGDVVLIDENYYILIELPGSVNFTLGDKILHNYRIYLHSLTGLGCYDIPRPLDHVKTKLKECDNIRVFNKDKYKLTLI